MSYVFMRPHFRKNLSKTKEIMATEHKTIPPSNEPTVEGVKKTMDQQNPALSIQVYNSIWKRIWNLIKNPFTYIFNGRIEW